LREATAAIGLDRLATAFLNIPGLALHGVYRGGDDALREPGRDRRRRAAPLTVIPW
jgi:hypothetical protein